MSSTKIAVRYPSVEENEIPSFWEMNGSTR